MSDYRINQLPETTVIDNSGLIQLEGNDAIDRGGSLGSLIDWATTVGQAAIKTQDFTLPVVDGDIDIDAYKNSVVINQGSSEDIILIPGIGQSTKGTAGKIIIPKFWRAFLRRIGVGVAPLGTTFTSISVTFSPTFPGRVTGTAWSPTGKYLAAALFDNSPYMAIYDMSVSPALALANPASLPVNATYDCAWSPDEKYIAFVCSNSPYVVIYDMSSGSPVKLTNPGTIPTGATQGCCWSPDSRFLAIATLTTPYVIVYDFITGAPVKIADPASLPGSGGSGGVSCAWTDDGRYLIVGSATSPFIYIYDMSSGSPVKISNPASLPATTSYVVGADHIGRFLCARNGASSPYIYIYDMITGAPVKFADPATLPANLIYGAKWSPDNRFLAVTHVSSPYITLYDFKTGIPVKISNPASLPAAERGTPSWSPDGRYLFLADNNTIANGPKIYDRGVSANNVWELTLSPPANVIGSKRFRRTDTSYMILMNSIIR